MTIDQKLNTIIGVLNATPEQEVELYKALEQVGIVATSSRKIEPAPTLESKPMKPNVAVCQLLVELGTPAHLKGYKQLQTAICMAVDHPEYISAFTTKLYPSVAEEFHDTSSRVERAIRHAVEVTWDRGDFDVLQQYFGNTVSCSKGKPTNAEFIARAAEIIQMRIQGEM